MKKSWIVGFGVVSVLGLGIWFGLSENSTTQEENIVIKEPIYAEVINFLPSGKNVQDKQEIVITFDKDVVPLGAMQRESIDIEITPKTACKWRWLNRSSLACTLDNSDKLKLATDYNITIPKHFSKEDNIILSKPYNATFSTVRPRVNNSYIDHWETPTKPYIVVSFSMPVTKKSVLEAFKITNHNNFYQYDIEVLEKVVTEDETSTSVEYKIDTSSPETAKQRWIVTANTNMVSNTELRLRLVGKLSSNEGPLLSTNSYTYKFQTLGEFEFLGVSCRMMDGKTRRLNVGSIDLKNKCDPMESVFLVFSSPISDKSVAEFVDFNPKLNYLAESYNPWEGVTDNSYFGFAHYKDRVYTVRIPSRIKADSKHTFTVDKTKMKDIFGRKLQYNNTITFATDNRKPNITLGYNNIVLEKDVDSDAALYATNIKQMELDFIRFTPNATNAKNQRTKHTIPTQDIKNVAYKTKMQIREALDNKSGVLYGEVHSSSLKHPIKGVLAQVTPFQVHAKHGYFNTLVWVSRFADAKPVEDANVTIYYGSKEELNNLRLISDAKSTQADGSVMIEGRESLEKQNKKDYYKYYFIHVEKDGDEALLPLDYGFKIYNADIYDYPRAIGQHAKVWGTTPQGVYKLGDEVAYKIYHRDQNNTHLTAGTENEFEVRVYDAQNTVVHQSLNNVINQYGTIDGSFVIPKNGISGNYRFELKNISTKRSWNPMNVLVSDFTPAPFRVMTQLDKNIYIPKDSVKISTHATMFSGGAYAHAPVRVSAYIKEEPFVIKDAPLKDFYFLNPKYEEKTLINLREDLDEMGEHIYEFKLDDVDIAYGNIIVEASVEDERGKFVSAYTKASYAQRDRFVGLRNTEWVYEKSKPSAVQVVVVGSDKKPLKGVKVDVDIEYKEYRSARVKGAGNAFVTVNSSQWIKESTCHITSSKEIQECTFTPKNTGSYRFRATIEDSKKNISTTEIYGWVRGEGSSVWNQSNDATLEIVPESNNYKIGDKARYLIKNPFETTEALITIERYGILDSWVESFDSATPIVEFDIKEEYLPGFYLSVVALSPRVAKPIKDGVVDLGKPSYKMGYVQTQVNDARKELEVLVSSDKTEYKPQEKVKLTIDVKNRLNTKAEEYELAVAVVDASVLALNKKGDRYYDLYRGLNQLGSLDVQNFSLISRLIGRQNFEKKGANQGGDGGSEGLGMKSFRDDFKYIAYWNPSIEVISGKSTDIEFTLPDNLTEYKVIVLAISKTDTMGHGTNSFKVDKEIQLRPIMPNQLLEGDRFEAGFSVLNRTDTKRKLNVSIVAKGAATGKKNIKLDIAAFAREKVYLPLETINDGNITLQIYAGDTKDSDALEHVITVNKKSSLLTMANFGSTMDDEVKEAVKVPENIETDVGSIGVTLSSTVLGNLDGAFVYLKEYPYWCWEQRLSKGLGAVNYLSLKEYLGDEVEWTNAQEETQKMLEDASSYQAPNGGMAFWVGANEYVNPYISAYTALGFSWLRESGYTIDFKVQEHLQRYLTTFLTQLNLPQGYNQGMNASIRAVALHALAREGKTNPYQIERYLKHYKMMSLFGKAHYFQAMLYMEGLNQQYKDELLDSILATATQSAGKFDFSEKLDNEYAYMLNSSMRTNCVVLSALVKAKKVGGYENKIGDIPPKLMRTITQNRGGKNHWENTQENFFCIQAIKEYAELYESEDVSMDINVLLDDKKLANVEFTSKKDTSKEISKTITKEDVGADKTLVIKKEGTGRLYYTSRISYAPKAGSEKAINAGFEIYREYAKKEDDGWKLLTPPFEVSTGDVVRVDLYIYNASVKHFVVLNDPIAGGFEPVNIALATSSVSDADTSKLKMAQGSRWYDEAKWNQYGWYGGGFYHKDYRHDSAQFYADYLKAGNYHLSYTMQAIAAGEFHAMPTHIEQMYDPDVFGKTLPALFIIK